MKQTAVEWLEKEIFKYMQGSNIIDLFNQAKEMEKQQIIDAFDIACNDENRIGKEYFNETYNDVQ